MSCVDIYSASLGKYFGRSNYFCLELLHLLQGTEYQGPDVCETWLV